MNYGFVRVGAAIPEIKVADCVYNAEKITELIEEAENKGLQIVVFPELCITAYTCGDLFHQHALTEEAVRQLGIILDRTKEREVVSILGIPLRIDNQMFNCAVVIQKGKLLGIVPKSYIPGYSEFYEERWFAAGSKLMSDSIILCGQNVPVGTDLLFEAENMQGMCFGVEICEDLWTPIPPSSYQSLAGASVLFNLSASNDLVGKHEYRKELVKQQSARCIAGYVYASANINESTTDVVFGGHALIAENGSILTEAKRFLKESQLIYSEIDIQKITNDRCKNTTFMEGTIDRKYRKIGFQLKDVNIDKLSRFVDAHPFVPSDAATRDERCSEIFNIQTAGLRKRMMHTGLNKAVIGVSGGLDSTLALMVSAKTLDLMGLPRKNILAFTMPGFGTTDQTYNNAMRLMEAMDVTIREIDIVPACLQHFKDIGHDPDVHDVTYENVQARERYQILMDIANKEGGLVVGTGDLSELALGWCTYNGDHMSMYSVNCSVPKTLVKSLVQWVADNVADSGVKKILEDILDTPISPELIPPDESGRIKQKTEDIVGPYELHDFFLYHMLRYGAPPKKIMFLAKQVFSDKYAEDTIKHWLKTFYRRFFSQQFKRSCLPDGPKVGSISLSPRGDWRMPSDASAAIWLKELE